MAELALWGAGGFGLLLGWMVYYTNRHRSDEVRLSDLGVLVGVIAGAGVTSLFNDDKGLLFGAYGVGLALGFFAYFTIVVVVVWVSDGLSIKDLIIPRKKDGPGARLMTKTHRGVESSSAFMRVGSKSVLASRSPQTVASFELSDAANSFRALNSIDQDLDAVLADVSGALTLVRTSLEAEGLSETEREALRSAKWALIVQGNLLQRLKAEELFLSDDIQAVAAKLRERALTLKTEAARFTKEKERLESIKKTADKVLGLVGKIMDLFG